MQYIYPNLIWGCLGWSNQPLTFTFPQLSWGPWLSRHPRVYWEFGQGCSGSLPQKKRCVFFSMFALWQNMVKICQDMQWRNSQWRWCQNHDVFCLSATWFKPVQFGAEDELFHGRLRCKGASWNPRIWRWMPPAMCEGHMNLPIRPGTPNGHHGSLEPNLRIRCNLRIELVMTWEDAESVDESDYSDWIWWAISSLKSLSLDDCTVCMSSLRATLPFGNICQSSSQPDVDTVAAILAATIRTTVDDESLEKTI